jgi:hypothetical protein
MMLLASDFGSGQVFWSLFWLTIFLFWVWLAITIIADVLQHEDLSGTTKAVWVVVTLIVPFLGALTYIAWHGEEMSRPRPPKPMSD